VAPVTEGRSEALTRSSGFVMVVRLSTREGISLKQAAFEIAVERVARAEELRGM